MKVALDKRQLKAMLEVPNVIAEVNSLCSELDKLSHQRPFTFTFGPAACNISLPAVEGKEVPLPMPKVKTKTVCLCNGCLFYGKCSKR